MKSLVRLLPIAAFVALSAQASAACDAPSDDAPAALARDLRAVRGENPPRGPMTGFTVLSKEKTDVHELSGVAVLPDGRLVMVDDERGIYLHTPGVGGAFLAPDHIHRLSDSEGIAVSPDGNTLYVASEDERKIHTLRIHIKRGALSLDAPESIGKLPKLDDVSNKGWEGITFLPASSNPDHVERLIGVHEGDPRRIGLFNPKDLDDHELVKLPHDLKDSLDDLSDIAVDPVSGHIFLLSDESSALAETRLFRNADGELEIEKIAVRKLPIGKELHPEGIAFSPDGSLWLVSEGDRTLRHLSIER